MRSKISISFQNSGNSDFHVWALDFHEGISELYRCELDIVSPKIRTVKQLKDDALGKDVTVTIEQVLGSGIVRRYISGIITAVRHNGSVSLHPGMIGDLESNYPKGTLVHITVEPNMALMKLVRRTQDYPDATPVGVVKKVFERNGISLNIDATYIEQEKYQGQIHFIQNDESDFDFVTRIMARYGISYFFCHDTAGQEQVYISDGNAFPAASPIEFSEFSGEEQNALSGVSESASLNFSMEIQKLDKALFRLSAFEATSRLGVDCVKTRFLHPADAHQVAKENGASDSKRVWYSSNSIADYDMNVEADTLENDLQRAIEAKGRSLRLAQDEWFGEAENILPMPGKILNISGFYSASENDTALSVKVTSSDFSVSLANSKDELFKMRFKCMDFDSAALEKRFCVQEDACNKMAASGAIREAIVCDRYGKVDSEGTINSIVPSPHSTAEMPWVFMVRNENPEDDNLFMDVTMTMPLGGERAGLYHFPRVGERVLIHQGEDHATLLGYVPDKNGAFSEFRAGSQDTRNSTAMRFTTPGKACAHNGMYNEVGFSFFENAAKLMEQRIIDGTALDLIMCTSINRNEQEKCHLALHTYKTKIEQAHDNFFALPGDESVKAVVELAKELVDVYKLDCDGDVLKLYSNGSIIQYSPKGIDITTDGTLNICAGAVNILGKQAATLQSFGVVRSVAENTSVTATPHGITMRSLKITGVPTAYDSTIVINPVDGVTINGGNLRFNALFGARISESMGASITVSNGVFQGAGGVIDMATVTRKQMTDAFSSLSDSSGLNRINEALEAWKGGTTPDGRTSRPMADRDLDFASPMQADSASTAKVLGNYRGTISGVAAAAGDLYSTESYTYNTASSDMSLYRDMAGANPNMTISSRELLHAKVFSQQLDAQRNAISTVNNTILEERSASVTVHGHQLDVNVMYINDLSNKKITDSADEGGNAGSV